MRSLLFGLCTFFSVQASANTLLDSVGAENNNGNLVILHKVAPKESYYSIGRLYSVPPKDIIAFNNNIALQIGVLVKVPTQRAFSSAATTKATAGKHQANSSEIAIEDYKVGPKESLYAIARKFGTTVEDIKQLNNLQTTSLSVGQVLKIRANSKQSAANGPAQKPSTPAATQPTAPLQNTPPANVTPSTDTPAIAHVEKTKAPGGRLGVTERSERGVAVWIADENLDGTKMLALHRTAPVGTIVKITNPMTSRTTFVKVIGKFTENEATKDAIIVLTKATADLLGALDKRFQVSIDYGVPNE